MEIKEVIQTQLVIQNHCVDDFRLDVIYTSKHKFRVFVTQLSTSKQQMREIDCIFDVLWGIDQIDYNNIMATAEAIAEDFDKYERHDNGSVVESTNTDIKVNTTELLLPEK